MNDAVLIALIAAVPPTLAALAAFRHARDANRATNQVNSGEPRLVERVHRMELRQIAIEEQTRNLHQTIDHIHDDVRAIVTTLMEQP